LKRSFARVFIPPIQNGTIPKGHSIQPVFQGKFQDSIGQHGGPRKPQLRSPRRPHHVSLPRKSTRRPTGHVVPYKPNQSLCPLQRVFTTSTGPYLPVQPNRLLGCSISLSHPTQAPTVWVYLSSSTKLRLKSSYLSFQDS